MMNNFDPGSVDKNISSLYFNFSSLINTALSIERENNALLDTFRGTHTKTIYGKTTNRFRQFRYFTFIEQRFRFLSEADGHATRTFLTAQEIIFLRISNL